MYQTRSASENVVGVRARPLRQIIKARSGPLRATAPQQATQEFVVAVVLRGRRT